VIANRINVTELGLEAPDLLVLDLDDVDTDPIELLRMTRFVLPTCVIAVYSGKLRRRWARSCHLAGANCILSMESDKMQIAAGLQQALTIGCFTDSRFIAAQESGRVAL
jgi:DNA-binding NarL/FixJ family response regulator